MKARVGLCFLDRPDASEQIRLAQLADRRGFESVWICETRLVRDAISIMGAVAASTEQIKICAGVVNNWTRVAALMAVTFATLDELSRGRAVLGIGAYWDPLAWKQGIERRMPLIAMREYVEVFRRLLNLERVTFEGKVVHVRDHELDLGEGVPRIPKRVPVYIGATGPQMLELSGEIADGVLLNGNTSLKYTRTAVEHVKVGCARAGRDIGSVDLPQTICMAMSRDAKAAKEVGRRTVTAYLGQQPHVGLASGLPREFIDKVVQAIGAWPPRPGGLETATRLVGDDIVDTLCIAGTPEYCRQRAEEYVEAGGTYPVILPLTRNVEEIIHVFAE